MDLELDPGCAKLGEEILTLYERARRQSPTVAEHLLCALEELVKVDPRCGATLDCAYLLIGGNTSAEV